MILPRTSSIPTASNRACCTIRKATAAPPRAFSTWPRAACRFPTTSWACPNSPSPECWRWRSRRRRELLQLPFTSTQPQPAECFVSLLLRPLVCPEVPGFTAQKTMEVRFFVPGNLVSNLDFVEAIFENGGDPLLPENDAALDSEHWTGHTGCVILAPHLIKVTKKAVGLPHFDQATERQRRDGMCWKKEDELYNGGNAFKLTARDATGVIVTIIADNYFGYCKKEVKTQLSFAANLFGLAEEEHAGGALVFPSYDLGEEFNGDILSAPAAAFLRGDDLAVWRHHGREAGRLRGGQKISGNHLRSRLGALRFAQPENLLDQPAFRRAKHPAVAGKNLRPPVRLQDQAWKNRPATAASGGWSAPWPRARSATSPARFPAAANRRSPSPSPTRFSPARCSSPDLKKDFDRVAELIDRDYSDRFADKSRTDQRNVLVAGALARLGHQAAHAGRARLHAGIQRLAGQRAAARQGTRLRREALLQAGVGRRLARPFQRGHHQRHARQRVEMRQPQARHHLSARGLRRRRRVAHVRPAQGFPSGGESADGGRHHGLGGRAGGAAGKSAGRHGQESVAEIRRKTANSGCSSGPDDAIHRGYDKQAEQDFVQPDNFFSNYEPLTPADARDMVEDALGFNQFTEPMQKFVREVAETGAPDYFVCTANPRLVDGKPTKNPRYLQKRPDLVRAERNVSGGNFRAPAPPRAAGPAAAHAGHRRAAGPPQQSARSGHPLAGVLQPDSLHGTAGVVHGGDLQHDRQIAVHHRRRLRGRADQGAVQRAAADH